VAETARQAEKSINTDVRDGAVPEKSLRDEAVAGDEGVARAVSETFGCQLDGNPEQRAPKGGCVSYTAAVRNAKKEILVK
jgi:hypothetical protein